MGRNIKIWGLAFSAMLLISGMAVANASAAEWKINGNKIAAAVATEGSGTLELTDEAGGPFGEKVTVKCTGTTKGTAGPGAADTTTSVTVSSCTAVTGVCVNPKASAVNLPWKTELVVSGGVVRDKITSGGSGAPGYEVQCEFFGIKATDVCTSETGAPKVTTGVSPVPLEFDTGSGTANCTRGGANKGNVRGKVTVKSSAGTLTVS
jgi:hypothetical protein